MLLTCKSIGCCHPTALGQDFCIPCQNKEIDNPDTSNQSLVDKYPEQYKTVGDLSEIDAYAVHHIFQVRDHSGCLQQASSKLLQSSNSKTLYQDIKVARDMLTRWLQLNQELNQ